MIQGSLSQTQRTHHGMCAVCKCICRLDPKHEAVKQQAEGLVVLSACVRFRRPCDAVRGCQRQRHQTQMRMTMPQWWWARMEWRNSHSTTSGRSSRWLLVSSRKLGGLAQNHFIP
jgi:hypothetical protein